MGKASKSPEGTLASVECAESHAREPAAVHRLERSAIEYPAYLDPITSDNRHV